MSETGKALSGRLSVPNELRFAYWQKWTWETADVPFREKVPGAAGQPHITIEGGGHFLQETRAEDFAQVIIEAIHRSNP